MQVLPKKGEMSMMKRLILFSIFIVAVFFAGNAVALSITEALPGWHGSEFFNFDADGRSLVGRVDYAVYDNSDQNYTYPGTAPQGGRYIYAYQVFNETDPCSNVNIESLSVAILDGVDVGEIDWFDHDVFGGVDPSVLYFSPDENTPLSARFMFIYPDFLHGGEYSSNLLFSSDNSPTWGYAHVEGTSVGGMVENLPTPAPEPASIIVLGGGCLVFAIKRKMSV